MLLPSFPCYNNRKVHAYLTNKIENLQKIKLLKMNIFKIKSIYELSIYSVNIIYVTMFTLFEH